MIVGPDRYDYKKMPHNHAICTKCGKVFDFDYDFKLEMKDINYINALSHYSLLPLTFDQNIFCRFSKK